MSDTPRTNLEAFFPHESMYQVCDADFCRQLERELNEANKTISLQHELMTTAEKRGVDKAKEELNEAKDRIKRLEEAGDELSKTQTYDLLENVNWRKAKEAKP
jgi:uncharacterized protein Yka (UPF0111/DUF47 family)